MESNSKASNAEAPTTEPTELERQVAAKLGDDPYAIARRRALLEANEAVTTEYVKNYEWDAGDDGYHVPTEPERCLIEDAIAGLLANDDFVWSFNAWQDEVRGVAAALSRERLANSARMCSDGHPEIAHHESICPLCRECDAVDEAQERERDLRGDLSSAVERERLANNEIVDLKMRVMRKAEHAAEWQVRAEQTEQDCRLANRRADDIPTIIRRSTWRTPELRESAARLVANILRDDDDPHPPIPPDHFPVA